MRDAGPTDPRRWAAAPPSGVRRYLPVLTWLPAYDRTWLRFDVIAGATIWGLLVPEMIAYAGLAGLPPQAGLYTLLVTLAAYAIFGTSRHVVVAGTSAAAILVASGVADVNPSGAEEYATPGRGPGALLRRAVPRGGPSAARLHRPVPVAPGHARASSSGSRSSSPSASCRRSSGSRRAAATRSSSSSTCSAQLGDTSGATLIVGVLALVLLFGAERLAPRLPGGLIALVLGIALSWALDLSEHGVAVVGEVPSGLPSVAIPDIAGSDALALLAAAGGMVLVIFSESLGAAQTFAAKHGYEIDPDQELIALGVANTGSALVGGLAAGGSLSQTAVNEGAGARSELAPIVAAALGVITVLFLTPLFQDLPEAVLAALIIHAVSHLMKVGAFRRYWAERPPEFWLGLATLVGVVTLDVLPGLRDRRRLRCSCSSSTARAGPA